MKKIIAMTLSATLLLSSCTAQSEQKNKDEQFSKEGQSVVNYEEGDGDSGAYFCDKSDHGCDLKGEKAHTLDDGGKCTVCDRQAAASEGIVYAISADGTHAEVTGYTASATEVVIADRYKGVPVTEIADGAFEDKTITSVVIPDSVTSIGNRSFRFCHDLAEIVIPDSVKHIGLEAFACCCGLTSVVIPDSVTMIEGSAFSSCVSLASATIGNGVTELSDSVFSYCESLTNVTIPDGVMSIGSFAFQHCTKLASITIPDSVTSVGVEAFTGCDKLIENVDRASYVKHIMIDLDDSATSVKMQEGTTIIAGQALARCVNLTNVTIPHGVTSIGGMVFADCTNLKSVVIPDSVTNIGSSLFAGCKNLESITIPDSVTSIGYHAFAGCMSLKTVDFNGTTPQWEALIAYAAGDIGLSNYTVYCDDGTVTY